MMKPTNVHGDYITKQIYSWGDSNEHTTYITLGEAYDLSYENGKFLLHLRQRQGNAFVYFQYSSTDLIEWTLIE